jgi:hypothetical protein
MWFATVGILFHHNSPLFHLNWIPTKSFSFFHVNSIPTKSFSFVPAVDRFPAQSLIPVDRFPCSITDPLLVEPLFSLPRSSSIPST